MSYALRAWDYLVFISSFSGLGTLRPTLVILFIPYLFCFLVWVHFVLLRFKLNLFGCICISLALGFSLLYQFLVTSSLFCSGLPALLRLFNLTVGQRHGVYKLSRKNKDNSSEAVPWGTRNGQWQYLDISMPWMGIDGFNVWNTMTFVLYMGYILLDLRRLAATFAAILWMQKYSIFCQSSLARFLWKFPRRNLAPGCGVHWLDLCGRRACATIETRSAVYCYTHLFSVFRFSSVIFSVNCECVRIL